MNKYLITFLLGACAFNSYGMFRKKEAIIPATPPAPPRTEAEIQESYQKSYKEVDRQIILYYLKRNMAPTYPTWIPSEFAKKVIAEYQKEQEEFADQRFADMQASLCKTNAILKKVNL